MDEVNLLDEIFLNTEMGKYLNVKFSLNNYNLRLATLETILAAYKDFGGKRKPNIAISGFFDLATMPEFIALKNYFIKQGYSTEICDISILNTKKVLYITMTLKLI